MWLVAGATPAPCSGHLHRLVELLLVLMKIFRYGAPTTMDEHEAKVTAKRIFHNAPKPGSKQEEALKAMDLFEGAKENSWVTKRTLNNWVISCEAFAHPQDDLRLNPGLQPNCPGLHWVFPRHHINYFEDH